ncbi:hypothetical protein [Chryseobacterium sp. HR92]|uniref:hypothetical protein n=1 Tax=Chryseobacterium sp. HR92 TaxID=3094839 RepID=UPI003890CA45|nr:hypothetical protein SFA27_13495 [Chryseobacterium sp. HR92]
MELLEYIYLSLPMVSSLTCGILFVVAYVQQLTKAEQQAKKLLGMYFACMVIYWLVVQMYPVYNSVLIYFIPLICFVLHVMQVVFYHFIYLLTPLQKANEPYAKLHYIIPLGLLAVSTAFMVIFTGVQHLQNNVISAVYAPYIFFSTIFFILCYTVLECSRIIRYKKRIIRDYGTEKWKNMRWLKWITVLKILFIIVFAFNRMKRDEAFFLLALLICLQHLIIVYNVLMRNYTILSFYHNQTIMITRGQVISLSARSEDTSGGKVKTIISGEELESYYRKNKPYLNSTLKINDVADHFKINRTYMSGFINKTFGVNFSQYNNLWRLKEMESLQQCHKHKDKNQADLALMAGFNTTRSYWRAKKLLRKEMNIKTDEYYT